MGKLSKKYFIERWKTAEGQDQRRQIINCFINRKPIGKLPFIRRIDGYYDLRGIYFDNKTVFKKAKITNVDFSYSVFDGVILDGCRIDGAIFEMCDCIRMLQYACHFNNCRFVKSKLSNSGFGIHGGRYDNILFEEVNFNGAIFFSPDFFRCVFKNCKMNGIDFSASHFDQVKFVGKLDDVWFRGESPRPDMQKQLKKRRLNPMVVDFSEAYLWFVTYSDNCDLSKVILPKDGQHYLIGDVRGVIQWLEGEVAKIDDLNTRKFVEKFIVLYKHHTVKQDMLILNLKEVISVAERYLGANASDYCRTFVDKLLQFNK
jgi:hypothetical protein